jgi:type I restriction enzyme, S subunit
MELKPGYRQTEVGVIPADWGIAPVGHEFDICNNLRKPISRVVRKRMEGPYPYYGPTGIQDYINEYRVDGECALIGEDGDHFLKWNDQPMTQLVCGRFNVNNHAHLIRGTKNLTAWFYHYFSHRDLSPYLTRQGAGRYKLTKNVLAKIPCAFPPTKAEQKAIAEALSDVDALVKALDQLIAKKRDLRQATMQQLLTGKRRLPGFNREWEYVTANEAGHFRGGNGFALTHQGAAEGTYPFFKVSDMNNEGNETFMYTSNHWISEAVRKRIGATAFLPNTIVFAKVGAAIFLERKKILTQASCIDNNLMAYVLNINRVNCRFMHYLLSNTKLSSLVSTTALPSLSGKILSQLSFALPPLSEQIAVAAVLSDMDVELAALEQRRDKTRALKQGMMQELLTGKTRLV